MLTLLAMIGLFLLVLGLVIVLLMGMFFSSDMGGIFVNVFNYATSTGIADLVTVGVMLVILFAAFAVRPGAWSIGGLVSCVFLSSHCRPCTTWV